MNFNTDDESLRTRVFGLGLICTGICLIYLNYYMRENSGEYYPMLAFIAPLLAAIGAICVVEAPKLPIEKTGFFGWFCLIVGSSIGIWNAIF